MNYKLAIAKGDGIGPEVIDAALVVLNAIEKKYGYVFNLTEISVGGNSIDRFGTALSNWAIEVAKSSDAVLFGAVGDPKWNHLAVSKRPEQAILGLRKALGTYANLRPGILFDCLKEASPLKSNIVDRGFDILVVRELIGGIYFGEKGTKMQGDIAEAYDVKIYSEKEVMRIAQHAFNIAMQRRKKLTSVDKANVLESSKLWRCVVEQVAKQYPEVTLEHLYVDNAAMQLVRDPSQFDVILAGNMFGDILSDEMSVLTGSIGLLPSASIAETGRGIYEPIHGSAPDIAGKNIANPLATILSLAMMFEHSLNLKDVADRIRDAVKTTLAQGYRTSDISRCQSQSIGTRQITQRVCENI